MASLLRIAQIARRVCLTRADEQWFAGTLGQALLKQQQNLLDQSLSCLFGYHLLQLGVSTEADMGANIRISHRFSLHPELVKGTRPAGIAQFTQLPLACESLDAVILHHALDYTDNPHALLREAARVVMARGHLVIIGFNPYSLWGIWASIARLFSRRACWHYRALRMGRLLDWLNLLNFEVVETRQGFYRPPCFYRSLPSGTTGHLQGLQGWGKNWVDRLRLPGGGFYMVVARNDQTVLTPLKPAWKSSLALRGLAVQRILHKPEARAAKTDVPSAKLPP